ncbi:MAG: hypothetical protein RL012_289 [Bacteroidota bacterium]|jgi:hypothetical protein
MTQILTFRYICSVFLCLGMLASSLPTRAKTRYWPTGIQLGMDVFRPFQYKYYGRQGTPYELNTSIDFARCILEGDYGWGSIHWKGCSEKTSTSSYYASDGQYFRVGLNYNFLQDTPNKNMAFLGFRYARSFFQDHLVSKVSYDSRGPIKNQDISIDSKQHNVKARWFEAVAGVKVKVWKLLYAGGTMRYKFGLRIDQANCHTPYDVLGWGLNDDEPFGFNLYLSLHIPFVYDTPPSSPKE